jgi:hypothetical protein
VGPNANRRYEANELARVEQLEKQVESLTGGLQKVSAQLELSKAAAQTVANDH